MLSPQEKRVKPASKIKYFLIVGEKQYVKRVVCLNTWYMVQCGLICDSNDFQEPDHFSESTVQHCGLIGFDLYVGFDSGKRISTSHEQE